MKELTHGSIHAWSGKGIHIHVALMAIDAACTPLHSRLNDVQRIYDKPAASPSHARRNDALFVHGRSVSIHVCHEILAALQGSCFRNHLKYARVFT